MEKKISIIFLVTLLILLAFSSSIYAADYLTTPYGYINSYFGVSYNTLSMEKVENLMIESYTQLDEVDEVSSNRSSYIGVRHWFDGLGLKDWAVGVEFEKMNPIEYDEPEVEIGIMSAIFTGSCRLSEINEFFPQFLYISAGAGLSQASLDWDDTAVLEDEYDEWVFANETYLGPAFKFGILGIFHFHDNIGLGGRANYRFSRPHSEGDLDIQGFEVGIQLEISI